MQPNIFPVVRYQDAPAAIAFLVDALGFEKRSDHRLPDGRVAHADLGFGPSVVGISSAGTSPPESPWASAQHGVYVVTGNPDALFARARSAGAEIAMPIADQSHGSRDFTLRDPEGHLWGFGTYPMERGSGEPTIFPEVLYRDAYGAVSWLEHAVGFRSTLKVPADDGSLRHAELHLDDGVVFVGTAPTSGQFVGLTHFANLLVADPDEHCARARAAGAAIVMEPQRASFGARFYAARDREEGLWWVSDYRPAR